MMRRETGGAGQTKQLKEREVIAGRVWWPAEQERANMGCGLKWKECMGNDREKERRLKRSN